MVIKMDIIKQVIWDAGPELIKILLSDKTTRKYIRWGSDNYKDYGPEYSADQEMKPELMTGNMFVMVQPRIFKSDEERNKRIRDKAEVFTPSWVCNEQNNMIDAAWFGRDNVFNIAKDESWNSILEPIEFPCNKNWMEYVDARRMEVSCGEAPYLVSRYDTVSGLLIPIKERIGFLDRKLRIVTENAKDDNEWLEWVYRAFQSCYGYDFYGDNVLLARENLLCTFIEYMEDYMRKKPSFKQLKKMSNIIAWNIWQMNGLTMTAPYSQVQAVYKQISFFDYLKSTTGEEENNTDEMLCRIFDWRAKKSIEFRSML